MPRSVWLVIALAAVLVGVWGCRPPGGDGDGDADADGDADGDGDGDSDADFDMDYDYDFEEQGCTKVDILFVIDNSGSMEEEQSNLAANFPEFIRLLEDYRTPAGTQLEYRVGVTSTSRTGLRLDVTMVTKYGGAACEAGTVCENEANTCECPALNFVECAEDCPGRCFCEPAGQTTAGPPEVCSGEEGELVAPSGYTEPWIDGPGEHVAAAFSDAATLGTGGCSLEMPLYAVEHALSTDFQSAPAGPNDGFLRDDALLMLIIMTDEDDCAADISEYEFTSIMDVNHPLAGASGDQGCTNGAGEENADFWIPVEHYLTFLDGLMGIRSHWAVAVIAGREACSSSYGNAYTAFRLQRFVEAAGSNAIFSDICDADLAGALTQALEKLQVACDDYILI